MRYKSIDNSLFVSNRERLRHKLLPNSLIILNSNDQFPANGDQYLPFVQNSDLFWASGLNQEKCIILLFPDCPIAKYKEAAFILKTNQEIAIWEGYKYSTEEAVAISGIKSVFWLEDFEMILHELMSYAHHVYINANENPKFKSEVEYRDLRFTRWIREQYPNHKYERLAPIMMQLRLIKSEKEIDLIREACNITASAFHKVLKFVKAGVTEYEIEALISHEFTVKRADGHAFEPIVATGKNALCLHYISNNDVCKEDELLLLDFGAKYAMYSADLSRTIPVNGKFSKRQKECYQSVLNVFKEMKKFIGPGMCIDEINTKAGKLLEKEMIALGLFTQEEVDNQPDDKALYTKYFMHGNSHFLGLDVHDPGTKQMILKPGMLLSCEPGLYINEEGIGIRIETDLLITEHGADDLFEHIPVEVDEIEKLMTASK